MSLTDAQTPQEEAADWATWLDRFEDVVWPVFERRGYSKETAATIYFRIYPHAPVVDGDDADEEETF
jgi:predicted phage-related endonuclease